MKRPHFACLYERFPSFTQTFCAREAQELQRQGIRLLLFSIRSSRDEAVQHFPESLVERTICLPPRQELTAEVNRLKERNLLPPSMVLTLRHWGDRPDKSRLYEAAWTGHRLRQEGVRHVHTHFAGLAARTCWWIRRFYGCSFSMTGHANDLFCDPGGEISLGHLVRDAAATIAVSDFTARWLRDRFPRDAGRIHRVYNGLDPEPAAAAARSATKDSPPLIVSVGRLIEKKGYDDLIAACAQLRDRGREFRCVVAGDGPLGPMLRQRIASAGLTDRVELAGDLPQGEVNALLGRASAFALACVTERDGGMDVLPTVIMEAMAAGLPVVSTTVAGVPEMVDDGRTGFLTGERRPAEFADALDRLLADPEAAARMGAEGRRTANAKFDSRVTTRQLRRILLSRGRTGFDPSMPLAFAQQLLRRGTRALRPPRLSRRDPVFPGDPPA